MSGLFVFVNRPLTYGKCLPLSEHHSSPDSNHITAEIEFKRTSPCTWSPLTYSILVWGAGIT